MFCTRRLHDLVQGGAGVFVDLAERIKDTQVERNFGNYKVQWLLTVSTDHRLHWILNLLSTRFGELRLVALLTRHMPCAALQQHRVAASHPEEDSWRCPRAR